MRYKALPILAIIVVAAIIASAMMNSSVSHNDQEQVNLSATPIKASLTKESEKFDGVKIVRSDDEWQKLLTPKQFDILRNKGTEQPYIGEFEKNHQAGTYYCAACGLALFSSNTKFESGTGWPSFFQPIYKENVLEVEDRSLGEVRTEVMCHRCGGHLGHVFDDGPEPTGLRYCINSAALKFTKK